MKALVFGAGSIGRGFLGELLFISSYEIILVDSNVELVKFLNKTKSYTINIVSNKETVTKKICIKEAISITDTSAISSHIENCDIIFTAVGKNALECIAYVIAKGLDRRKKNINIILCENIICANSIMHELLAKQTSKENFGLVRASVGRMVPAITGEPQSSPIIAEPYYTFTIDANGIKGCLPYFYGLTKEDNFDLIIDKKIFIHNFGHFAFALLGEQKGYTYIWQCSEDKTISKLARQCMLEAAEAIAIKYSLPANAFYQDVEDLIERFSNRGLSDTISRVIRNIEQKLSPGERVVGIVEICLDYNLPYKSIIKVYHLGLKYLKKNNNVCSSN